MGLARLMSTLGATLGGTLRGHRQRSEGGAVALASDRRIWREPDGPMETLFEFGPGGPALVPVPPFSFEQEHFAGSQPCVAVRDARDRRWRVKWGHEVQPETFAVRFAAACGYFAEVTHLVRAGKIEGAPALSSARHCVDANGRFADARFELEDRHVHMLLNEDSWAWNDNPFVGTPQLTGLKLVVMLLSNWDTKDRRDVGRGSNTAIFEVPTQQRRYEAQYLICDWGGAMGKWGTNVLSRGRWDPQGFTEQSQAFIEGVDAPTSGGISTEVVRFGYRGQRTEDVASGIPVAHVRWFARQTMSIAAPVLRTGLVASGATDEEADSFAASLMMRLHQLRAL